MKTFSATHYAHFKFDKQRRQFHEDVVVAEIWEWLGTWRLGQKKMNAPNWGKGIDRQFKVLANGQMGKDTTKAPLQVWEVQVLPIRLTALRSLR